MTLDPTHKPRFNVFDATGQLTKDARRYLKATANAHLPGAGENRALTYTKILFLFGVAGLFAMFCLFAILISISLLLPPSTLGEVALGSFLLVFVPSDLWSVVRWATERIEVALQMLK